MRSEARACGLSLIHRQQKRGRWTLDQLLIDRHESQMVVSAIMPFVPEIREKMMGSTLQQYKEQLERIVKRINELPPA